MVREDMADARADYLKAAVENETEYLRRAESDFLEAENDAGQYLDFHSFRHTCGAWAIQDGNSIKAVQTLMRPSSVKLTLDTYGHLMPGEETETVHSMAKSFQPPLRLADRIA